MLNSAGRSSSASAGSVAGPGSRSCAGIGGGGLCSGYGGKVNKNDPDDRSQTITINGGNIEAAGIGGASMYNNGGNGAVTITGGHIQSKAQYGAGIGGGWGGQLSTPTWYLVALVILSMFSRKRWNEEEEEDGQDSAARDMVSLVWMGVIVIYVVFCLAAAAREYTGDAWIYYGLAMAGVFMFVLDRLKKNMPPLLLYTLSWVALIFPLLLSGILAQASS